MPLRQLAGGVPAAMRVGAPNAPPARGTIFSLELAGKIAYSSKLLSNHQLHKRDSLSKLVFVSAHVL